MKQRRSRISLCLIARDEQATLQACLESARPAVDQIIVVDTGSTDSTPAIAERLGAEVFPFAWTDDFSAARNHALSKATGDWILVLDSDERLAPGSATQIRRAVRHPRHAEAFLLPFADLGEQGPTGRQWVAMRLYRNRPGVSYQGRVHEQLCYPAPLDRVPVLAGAQVLHLGYRQAALEGKQKQARNQRLLQLELAEAPEEDVARWAFCLFYRAFGVEGGERALRLEQWVQFVEEHPELERSSVGPWIPVGLAHHAWSRSDAGKHRQAEALAVRLLERYGPHPVLELAIARARADAGDFPKAEKHLERLFKAGRRLAAPYRQFPLDLPLIERRGRALRGEIRERQGRLEEAERCYSAVLQDEAWLPALLRLICLLVQRGASEEALHRIEASPQLGAQGLVELDCLALALALITGRAEAVERWLPKVEARAAASDLAARVLQTSRRRPAGSAWRLVDFPDLQQGVRLAGPVDAPGSCISLCMITRDEERFLRQCLESARPAVDEIIVVDTGSKDSTVSIAGEFGARLLRHQWNDDFAAARNVARSAATGQWMLVLDADERLDAAAPAEIRRAVRESGFDTGYLGFVNIGDGGAESRRWTAPRLYRLDPTLRFIGRIHEQAVYGFERIRSRMIPATVYHYGYQSEVFSGKQKRERNTRLLEQALEDPEAVDPILRTNYLFHHANLAAGRELMERYERFAGYVRHQWPEGPPSLPWITGGLAEYARLLTDVGRYQEARRLAEELLRRNGESPMLHYLVARSLAAEGQLEKAEAELGPVLAEPVRLAEEHLLYSQDLPLVRGRARFLLGLIREKQGRIEEAIACYQEAVAEEPAQDLLRSRLVCALTRAGRYGDALSKLESSPTLAANPHPGLDCLGLGLSLLARSVGRFHFWGDKVRQEAPQHPGAARMLERLSALGARHPFRIDDFPELAEAVALDQEPGWVRMPQTSRQ